MIHDSPSGVMPGFWSCQLEDISGCVFFTKEVSPKQMRMTGWPLVGNEEMKPLHGCVFSFRFPHSLLTGHPNETTAASSGKSHSKVARNQGWFTTIHILDIGSWVQKILNKWKSFKKAGLMKLTIRFCKWNNNSHQSGNNESIEPKQKTNLQ